VIKSDNIPGVRRNWRKNSDRFIKKYDNLEDIYTNLESIKGMVKTKLLEGKPAAESSRYLAKIALDAPVSLEEEKFRLRGFDRRLVKPLLARLELKKILQKLDQIQQHLGGTLTLELTSDADSINCLCLIYPLFLHWF
jgi:DNA polymerase-1